MNKLIMMMCALIVAVPSQAALELVLDSSDGRIYLDTETGDYVIQYIGIEEEPTEVRWIPANKVDPEVNSNFSVANAGDSVLYKYRISNDRSAKQSISLLSLNVPGQLVTELQGPRGWNAMQRSSSVSHPDSSQQGTIRISWSALCEDDTCIRPGEKESSYQYQAQGIPGLTPLYVQGDAPTLIFPDYGPGGEVREFLDKRMPPAANSVATYVAAPVIELEGDPEDLLRLIAEHVDELATTGAISNDMGESISDELRLAADSLAEGDIAHASRILGRLRGFVASAAGTTKSEPNLSLLRDVLVFDLNFIQSKYMAR